MRAHLINKPLFVDLTPNLFRAVGRRSLCGLARVLEAGATVVFASDLNSMKNVRKLT